MSEATGTVETRADRRLLACATAVLLLGVLVYALCRPAGTAAFMPSGVGLDEPAPAILAEALGPLPTFLHALGFALVTIAVLPPGRRRALLVCGAWFLLEVAMEIPQHDAFKPAMAPCAACAASADPAATLDPIRAYWANGTFDPADLAAALLGVTLAWFLAGRRLS